MMTRPGLAGLLVLSLWGTLVLARAAEPIPPSFQGVLERRGLDGDRLRARGFVFSRGFCFRLDPAGLPVAPALTPEQLEAALDTDGGPRPIAMPAPPLALPRLDLPLDPSPDSLPGLYDGTAAAPPLAVAPVALAPASAAPAASTSPFTEAPFEGALKDLARGLYGKRPGAALAELEFLFAEDEASDTGLTPEAPEALRLLAAAIHDGKGGPEAPGLLRRALAKVAELSPERKAAFAARLSSPLTVFVAFARSRAPHALESRLYFRRMTELLDASSRTLAGFLIEADPAGRRAADFLLRVHAYDALVPHLNARPAQAAEAAAFLFPDGRPGEVRERAAQLEGLITQLALQGRRSGALEAFVRALAARAPLVDPRTAARLAVYLKLNAPLLPKALRAEAEASADAWLPPGLLDDEGLVPADPSDLWPGDEWRFALHFASTGSYRGWLAAFRAHGYDLEPSSGGVAVSTEGVSVAKDFGGLKVVLRATLYPGDQEGFLRGAEAARFLAGVSRDLRDPAVQGVILRNHAQFRILNLFTKRVTPGKLLLDGACRSAWDLQSLRRRCPSCHFIVNTGTGYGAVNNQAVVAVVEGLAEGRGWEEIGEAWARHFPRTSARIQGPWTPPFDEALRLLDAREAAGPSGAGR